jgi:anti-sigma regulatory factor (Ser/Thr protein kinase)
MRWSFESSDASRAYGVRQDLLAYLESRAGRNSDLGAAELIFGELVGNVVRHAPGPISIGVHWERGIAVLQIRDDGPGFDWTGQTELPDPMCESGRGLYIAKAAARAMRIRRLSEGGMEVTAWLPVRLDSQFRAAAS